MADEIFLFAGSPGIGKSYFLFFLMHHLSLKTPPPVVVLDIRNKQTLCFIHGKVMEGTREDFASRLREPTTWYLVGDAKIKYANV